MRGIWWLGRWWGIPIALHWTVLLGLPWFLYQTRTFTGMLVAFAAFTFLLLAHELGHAAVALWRRVEVVHIRLLFLHGVCAHEAPDYEEDDVLIAWGGVAAQFVVLVIALGVNFSLPTLSPVAYFWAAPALAVLIETNLLIMVLNLIPVATRRRESVAGDPASSRMGPRHVMGSTSQRAFQRTQESSRSPARGGVAANRRGYHRQAQEGQVGHAAQGVSRWGS